MAVLAVREYGRIQCGPQFDGESQTVSPRQHQMLERFSEDYRRRLGITVFQHGPRQTLVAQSFVGVINLGRDQVEVLPKIEGDSSVVRCNLARMICSVLEISLHGEAETLVKENGDTILEVLISLFCQRL